MYIKRITKNLTSTTFFQNRSSPLKQDYTRKRQGQRVRKMVSRARVCFEDFLPISRTMGTKFFWSRFLTTTISLVPLFSNFPIEIHLFFYIKTKQDSNTKVYTGGPGLVRFHLVRSLV